MCLIAIGKRLVIGLLFSSVCATLAFADGIDGTWRLIKRVLPDGTVQTPPAVVGLGTSTNGLRHLNVFWHTPDGKPASIGVISRIKFTATEYSLLPKCVPLTGRRQTDVCRESRHSNRRTYKEFT